MGLMLDFYKRQLFITPKVISADHYNLQNQCGIVTGANVGIGLEVSRHLLRLGLSKLILAVRSLDRGENARMMLATQYPNAEILVWQIDLSLYDSVKALANKCASLHRLDFAVLNAGIVKLRFDLNPATGHEETIQVNYLSTCLLATSLLPIIKSPDRPGKITIVGSEVAEWTRFKERSQDPILSSFDQKRGYDGADRYYVSKLLPEFYVKELGKRSDPDKVIVNIANPGLCYGSDLHRDAPYFLGVIFGIYKRMIGRTCEVGARPIVNAIVVQLKDSHGGYICDNDIAPMPPLTQGNGGDELSARLWKELMDELQFVDAETLVNSMKKRSG